MPRNTALAILAGLVALGYIFSSQPDRPAAIVAPAPVTPTAIAGKAEPQSGALPSPAAVHIPDDDKLDLFQPRYVTASSLNLRRGPGTNAHILGSLPRTTQLLVKEERDKWLLVLTPDGTEGWVSSSYTSATRPVALSPVPTVSTRDVPSRDDIAKELIKRSIEAYPGNCPCPYNADRAGRSCGRRSAWSKPGGRAPLCFVSDVTEQMIDAHLR